MPPQLALLIGLVLVVYAFRSDHKRSIKVTEIFWPGIWYLVVASRPVGAWLQIWGVPLPTSDDATDGSILDRFFYAILLLIGLKILFRRRFDFSALFRQNSWLTALLAFMAVSILWSNYPYVSFKRYIKVVGSIVMALVILTNNQPLEALLIVLRRCLYIHLPMSFICIKYFRTIGVAYDYSGSGMWWQGISTTKNTFGQVAMLGVVYFTFELFRNWKRFRWRNLYFLYLLLAIHLLKGGSGAISMTSVSVCLFALIVFGGIHASAHYSKPVQPFIKAMFACLAGITILVLVHSVVLFAPDSLFGQVITAFGRNITLTDRTYIWSDVYAAVHNPLIGVGFGGFWIGRIANIPWAAHLTWILGQGHNGYIDTYLQTGWIGSFLLAGVIFTTFPKLVSSLTDNFEFACFRITLFMTILFINITETTLLRGDHHLWLLFMVTLWTVPSAPVPQTDQNQFEINNDLETPAFPEPADQPSVESLC